MRSFVLTFCLIVLSAQLAFACRENELTQRYLNYFRQQWNFNNYKNYDITFSMRCRGQECPKGDFALTVENDKITNIDRKSDLEDQILPVTEVFDRIQKAINDGYQDIFVVYNSDYGFPFAARLIPTFGAKQSVTYFFREMKVRRNNATGRKALAINKENMSVNPVESFMLDQHDQDQGEISQ